METMVKKEKGITLIALAVTIIILLILATITMVFVLNSRVIEISKEAVEAHKIEEYREGLDLIRPELDIRRSDGKSLQTAKEYLTEYEKRIKEHELFKDAKRVELIEDPETGKDEIIVETKEGYVYKVTEEGVEYIGKRGEAPPPSLEEGDIDATITPEGWTNEKVVVTLKISEGSKEKLEGYGIEYLKEGKWERYTEGQEIIVEKNGYIYARAVNSLGEGGGSLGIEITKIDKLLPEEYTPTYTATTNKVTVIADVKDAEGNTDYGKSGMGKYRFSIKEGEWTDWSDENKYTFDKLERNTEYTIKIEAKDIAGNVRAGEVKTKTLEKLDPTSLEIDDYIGKYINYQQKSNTGDVSIGRSANGGDGRTYYYYTDMNVKWRIWSIDKDKITLISEDIVRGGDNEGLVSLKGEEAYNDVVYSLNNICVKCYSNSEYKNLVARSINIEDIQKVSNYDWTKEEGYGVTNGNVANRRAPSVYTLETNKDDAIKYRSYQDKSFGTTKQYDGTTTGSVFTNTTINHNYGKNTADWIHPKYTELVTCININGNRWIETYFLASRRTYVVEKAYIDFGFYRIGGGVLDGTIVYDSKNIDYGTSGKVRPMVEIPITSFDMWESNQDGLDFEISPKK